MKRIQNRIAESRWALPTTAAYGILVCLAAGMFSIGHLLETVLLLVATLMMVELNNSNSLIRIYNRMVSCSFLVMTTMSSFLLSSPEAGMVQVAFIAFLLLIFKAYQDKEAAGWVFYAFFAIGLGSIVFVQLLYFVPILWILLGANILALSGRTFLASIIGLIAPYWFVGAYYILTGHLEVLASHFMTLAQLGEPLAIATLGEHRLVTLLFILLIAVISSVHFILYSYKDKIRIRMIYEMLITLDTCCFIFILLQPQHADMLLSMSIVTTAPLCGHLLALSHTRLSNVFFFVTIAVAVAITAYNLWMP